MGVYRNGPGALALLIHRLLDDITARADDDTRGAPEGLELLLSAEMPGGTRLSRAQLEAARAHG